MKIISRKDAKTQGLKRYYTGNPCKNGHIDERKVACSTCVECHRIGNAVSEGRQIKPREIEKTHPDYITRSEAISRKLDFYFTGKECIRKHICERKVDTKTCVECDIERPKERRNNPALVAIDRRRTRMYARLKRATIKGRSNVNAYKRKLYATTITPEKRALRAAREREKYSDPIARAKRDAYARAWYLKRKRSNNRGNQ